MKILILGTTSYKEKMLIKKAELEAQGHEVHLPAFDDHPELTDGYQVCAYNRAQIRWADEVCVFWDNRSPGFIFDMGMIFMANKRMVIEYLESKTFEQVVRKYADLCGTLANCETMIADCNKMIKEKYNDK